MYPVTLGDLMCPDGGPECELRVSLTENVDRADLAAALQMTVNRFPFLATEIEYDEGRMFLKPSAISAEISAEDTPESTAENTPETAETTAENTPGSPGIPDNSVIRVSCTAQDIIFRFRHCIMDGRGGLSVLKTLLHCYILAHYKEDLRCDGLLVPSDPPSPEEYADPFQNIVKPGRSLRKICITGSFSIPEEDLNKSGPIVNYIVHIPGEAFLKYLSSQDQSPAPFLTLMLCRAIHAVYPDHEVPIQIHVPADIRKILGCSRTLQYCISSLWFCYDERIHRLPLDVQLICFRGMLLRQMYPDYIMQETAELKALYEHNLDCRRNGDPLYVPWKTMPYMLTYVGNTDFGAMRKYVKPLSIINAAPTPLLCSVTEAERIFRLSMELQTKTPAIYHAFLAQLDAVDISYTQMPEIYIPGATES